MKNTVSQKSSIQNSDIIQTVLLPKLKTVALGTHEKFLQVLSSKRVKNTTSMIQGKLWQALSNEEDKIWLKTFKRLYKNNPEILPELTQIISHKSNEILIALDELQDIYADNFQFFQILLKFLEDTTNPGELLHYKQFVSNNAISRKDINGKKENAPFPVDQEEFTAKMRTLFNIREVLERSPNGAIIDRYKDVYQDDFTKFLEVAEQLNSTSKELQ